jgi:hypothetical protein
MLDADMTLIDHLIGQYGACVDASDCTALPVLGDCVVVSTARSTEFLAAVSQASQGFEEAGCSPPGISCESVQVKCAGSCTAIGQLSHP